MNETQKDTRLSQTQEFEDILKYLLNTPTEERYEMVRNLFKIAERFEHLKIKLDQRNNIKRLY